MNYPISPLTASLLAGGWKLADAIQFHADPAFDAYDDVTAIEAAYENGWNGVDGIDIILNSYMGRKWAVLTTLLQSQSIVGVQKHLAKVTLDIFESRWVNSDFAHAAATALYAPEISLLADKIRQLAHQHLEADKLARSDKSAHSQ